MENNVNVKVKKIYDLKSYKEKNNEESRWLDLENTRHILHVVTNVGYKDEGMAEKSRVVTLMKLLANKKNLEIIKTDNLARGAYNCLLLAIKEDGTKLEFVGDNMIATLK